jgi:hypothetical protein
MDLANGFTLSLVAFVHARFVCLLFVFYLPNGICDERNQYPQVHLRFGRTKYHWYFKFKCMDYFSATSW